MDLYRFYDSDGGLLYIGISYSAIVRFAQHKQEKRWINDVAVIAVQHLGDIERVLAQELERLAIVKEKPKHNVMHSEFNRPKKRATEEIESGFDWLDARLLWLCDVCNKNAHVVALHKNNMELHVFCYQHQMVPDDRFDYEIKCNAILTRREASWWGSYFRQHYKRGKTNLGYYWDLRVNEAAHRSHQLATTLENLARRSQGAA